MKVSRWGWIVGIALFHAPFSWALTASTPALDSIWSADVQIRTDAVDTDGSSVPAYCNATLLSSHLLVTAAHCVLHAQVIRSFEVQVDVGAYKYIQKPDGTSVRIGYVSLKKETIPAKFFFTPTLESEIARSGLKTTISPGEDVALISLDREMDLDPTFSYGSVISQTEYASVRNHVESFSPTVVTINFFSEVSTDNKRMALLNNISWKSPSFYESKSSSRVEEGDSGSPLWVKIGKDWKLAGVVKGRGETIFSNWDAYPSVTPNLCAIAPALSLSDRGLICH